MLLYHIIIVHSLTHCCPLTTYTFRHFAPHYFRLVTCWIPGHYPNHYWYIVNQYFDEIIFEIQRFSFKEKKRLKMSLAEWWQFCWGLNMLMMPNLEHSFDHCRDEFSLENVKLYFIFCISKCRYCAYRWNIRQRSVYINFIPACMNDYIRSPFTKIGKECVILFHILLDMWFIIHAGSYFNTCEWRGRS